MKATGSIVEGDPDPPLAAPDDVAGAGAAVRGHHQHETVGEPERAFDFDGGAARRNVANEAIEIGAAERDGSSFQNAIPWRCPMVIHPFGIGQKFKKLIKPDRERDMHFREILIGIVLDLVGVKAARTHNAVQAEYDRSDGAVLDARPSNPPADGLSIRGVPRFHHRIVIQGGECQKVAGR